MAWELVDPIYHVKMQQEGIICELELVLTINQACWVMDLGLLRLHNCEK
jgi:hypothetical protein